MEQTTIDLIKTLNTSLEDLLTDFCTTNPQIEIHHVALTRAVGADGGTVWRAQTAASVDTADARVTIQVPK